MLEDHLLDQIKIWGLFSGAVNEQGGESTHRLFNDHQHMTSKQFFSSVPYLQSS
jgi:hypothetical protein